MQAAFEAASHGRASKAPDIHSVFDVAVIHTQLHTHAHKHTLAWMPAAPEVASHGRASMASDIYSLGVLMWQCYRCESPCLMQPDGVFKQHPQFPHFLPGTPLRFARLVARWGLWCLCVSVCVCVCIVCTHVLEKTGQGTFATPLRSTRLVSRWAKRLGEETMAHPGRQQVPLPLTQHTHTHTHTHTHAHTPHAHAHTSAHVPPSAPPSQVPEP